jgi:hypothetical protein
VLARRLTTILPAMTLPEALETTRLHRVAGLTGARTALVTTRPCRAPHHTLSAAGQIGGGQVPMLGRRGAASLGVSSMSRLRHLPMCSPIGRACRLTHRWVRPHSGHIACVFNPFVEVTHTPSVVVRIPVHTPAIGASPSEGVRHHRCSRFTTRGRLRHRSCYAPPQSPVVGAERGHQGDGRGQTAPPFSGSVPFSVKVGYGIICVESPNGRRR